MKHKLMKLGFLIRMRIRYLSKTIRYKYGFVPNDEVQFIYFLITFTCIFHIFKIHVYCVKHE